MKIKINNKNDKIDIFVNTEIIFIPI